MSVVERPPEEARTEEARTTAAIADAPAAGRPPTEGPSGARASEPVRLAEVRLDRGVEGMRIRRIRITSVMKVASVFFVLGYLVTLATIVVVWNVVQQLGFVEDIEETAVRSLGLESFDIVGQELFELAVAVFGVLFAMGLVISVLLTIVYNATGAVLGGLAVETGSLRRPRRVFSLRHRRFITVR